MSWSPAETGVTRPAGEDAGAAATAHVRSGEKPLMISCNLGLCTQLYLVSHPIRCHGIGLKLIAPQHALND